MPAAVKRPRPTTSDSEASGHEQRLAPPIALKPALRPSLRDYRDHVSETDATETETEDAEVELGGMLTSIERLTDDADVDASLASLPQSPLAACGKGKGKGVDPAERCLARPNKRSSSLYPAKRAPTTRRRVSPGCTVRSSSRPGGRTLTRSQVQPLRPTRRIVSPTESIYNITKCIDGLVSTYDLGTASLTIGYESQFARRRKSRVLVFVAQLQRRQ